MFNKYIQFISCGLCKVQFIHVCIFSESSWLLCWAFFSHAKHLKSSTSYSLFSLRSFPSVQKLPNLWPTSDSSSLDSKECLSSLPVQRIFWNARYCDSTNDTFLKDSLFWHFINSIKVKSISGKLQGIIPALENHTAGI